MRKRKTIYSIFHLGSAICLMVTLLWLTVSSPFLLASQQHLAKLTKSAATQSPLSGNEEEVTNPFSSNTEEKAPSGSSFSEEYLHDNHTDDYSSAVISQYHKCEDADTYIAFHGELLVPPPNAA